ncbi:hypothetical protein MB84_28220 (plasmid) [Pandoraea oxalativorans]|uniref:Uncharacterized protein n=1 Tax=Pandoraea oxalativorans TaxID=573737 RepID=A0A0G3IDL0_9BURK|nr:hypothetical protein MB84_28220 [Pandoraea oxalativorans]
MALGLNAATRRRPIAALDQALLQHLGVTKTGGAGDGGTPLALASQTFRSLRSRLGAEIRFALPVSVADALRERLQPT